MKYNRVLSEIKKTTGQPSKPVFTKDQIASLKSGSQVALAIIGFAGLAAISVIAPNLLQAFKPLVNRRGSAWTKREGQRKVANSIYYLKANGLIEFKTDKKGSIWVRLTSKGQRKFDDFDIKTISVPKVKWDGKWWMVAADIPTETHRHGADLLRQKLKDMGFFRLQKSLWFYPYDPRKQIEFIINYFGIGLYVTVMEISGLDIKDERKLKEHFKLK